MRRWHRRLGAVFGLVAMLFAFTGVLLNHADTLGLNTRLVYHPALMQWYGIEVPEPVAFAVDDHWLSHWSGNQLYFGESEVTFCEPPMTGAVAWQQQIVVACGDGLVLLTQAGEFIERLGAIYRLPAPITGLAGGQQLYLKTPAGTYQADLEALSWTPVAIDPQAVAPSSLPSGIESVLRARVAGAELTLGRVLADIHSGRILGALGAWLADIAAVGMLFLGASGLWMWWRQRRHR